jgi:hypothetical protein
MGSLPDEELALLVLEPELSVLLFLTCSALDWGAVQVVLRISARRFR